MLTEIYLWTRKTSLVLAEVCAPRVLLLFLRVLLEMNDSMLRFFAFKTRSSFSCWHYCVWRTILLRIYLILWSVSAYSLCSDVLISVQWSCKRTCRYSHCVRYYLRQGRCFTRRLLLAKISWNDNFRIHSSGLREHTLDPNRIRLGGGLRSPAAVVTRKENMSEHPAQNWIACATT